MADGTRLDETSLAARLARLEDLLEHLEETPGPTAREALEAVRALTEVYGEALARILDRADGHLAGALAEDELLGHLMVLHGIHPEPVRARVAREVERIGGELRERGGDLELVGVDEDEAVARVRLAVKGCGSSSAGILDAVREAVLGVAPELRAVEQVRDAPAPAFVPLEALTHRGRQQVAR
ncbi:NifU family protein [Streptomyces sp. NPDC046915]|uniref:NifU family protein n=1 Tax=Streptomyces sp. NPDC046915 TaxID=3155257 RepID=UPI0033D319FE